MSKFIPIKSRTVFRGKIFDVRQDEVRLPNGRVTTLDIVAHPQAVVLVPLDDNDHIWFVRQYRHAAEEVILELPAGAIESDETPENCALREIQEEIGMSAGKIQKIGEFFLAPGYSSEYLHIFMATDLKPDPLPSDEDEFIIVERIQVDIALAIAENGQFNDAKTLAALLLARSHLLE